MEQHTIGQVTVKTAVYVERDPMDSLAWCAGSDALGCDGG